jgi:putative endonuclease
MENRSYIYILTNKWHHVLYVGVTNNIERKIWEHREKIADGFSKKYNLQHLVYFEKFGDVYEAIQREKQIKSWPRHRKNKLIADINPYWKDLFPPSEIATPAETARARNDSVSTKENIDRVQGIDYE